MQTVIDQCRRVWADTDAAQARRLFHGRGHMYPGYEHVVVTWLPPCVLIAVFKETPESQIRTLVDGLCEFLPVSGVALQTRAGRATSTEVWWGEVADELLVQEGSLHYWVQPKRNQNIGLFMDMAHVRQALAAQMSGARVLNLFAYTCAFSVSAIAHGAELVVNNDMNRNMLQWGERNHLANQHDLRRVRMLPHNVFKSWWKIRQFGPYDVIVIDPPTNQRGSFVAEKNYGAVLKRIPELAAEGAHVMACLNSPFLDHQFLHDQMARWCPNCTWLETLPPHPDFPDRFVDRGLKVQRYVYQP